MHTETEDRRTADQRVIIVASRDEVWLHFAEKILRRTDEVRALHDLPTNLTVALPSEARKILMVSSELIPDKVKDFVDRVGNGRFERVCVLREPHDEHHRISDKHLKDLGFLVADRPDNSKAFHRLLKMACG